MFFRNKHVDTKNLYINLKDYRANMYQTKMPSMKIFFLNTINPTKSLKMKINLQKTSSVTDKYYCKEK